MTEGLTEVSVRLWDWDLMFEQSFGSCQKSGVAPVAPLLAVVPFVKWSPTMIIQFSKLLIFVS